MTRPLSHTFDVVLRTVKDKLGVDQGPSWRYTYSDTSEQSQQAQLSAELRNFIGSLYKCTTDKEEADFVSKSLRRVEEEMRSPGLNTGKVAEILTKVLACHTLGHKVSQQAKMMALNLAQKGKKEDKKMGYLACSLLLGESEDLVLMLMNTLVKDLDSHDLMVLNMTFLALPNLVPAHLMQMVVPKLVAKTTHSKSVVRKKALICLHDILKRNPKLCSQFESAIIQCLRDPDPGVMFIAMQVARTACENKKSCTLSLLPQLVSIQEQIMSRRLPGEYNKKDLPAPFAQCNLLALARVIVSKSPRVPGAYKGLNRVLMQTLNFRTKSSESLSWRVAILSEGISLAAALERLEPDPQRMTLVLDLISYFLKHQSNNSKYVGLTALEDVLRHKTPRLSRANEFNVLSCLEHPDDSIRRKTLSLMFVLAHKDNVNTICSTLLDHIKASTDPFQKQDLIDKVAELSIKYRVSLGWYVNVTVKLIQTSNSDQKKSLLTNLKSALTETLEEDDEKANQKEVAQKLLAMLSKAVDSQLQSNTSPKSSTVLELYIWLLQHCSAETPEEAKATLLKIVNIGLRFSDCENEKFHQVVVACLRSLYYFLRRIPRDCGSLVEVKEFVRKCSKQKISTQVADLGDEMTWLIQRSSKLGGPSQEEPSYSEDPSLSFLDGIVVKDLERGGRRYRPKTAKKKNEDAIAKEDEDKSLKFGSYQQMDKEALKKMMSPEETTEGKAVPQKWTLQGLIETKEDTKEKEGANNLANSKTLPEPNQTADPTAGQFSNLSLDDIEDL